MPDNKWDNPNKKIPQDASKISLTEPYEVSYWCTKFGCTESELKAAVKAVGHSVAAVKKYLGK